MQQPESIAARTALVLETNNLRGGADLDQALASLKRLIAALHTQTLRPQSLAQWIITHDGFTEAACADIAQLAGFPIDFVTIDADHSYYEAKNLGFDRVDARRCDYVAFCDADCVPAAQWLEQLLLPFSGPAGAAPQAVAGRTSYSASVMGVALTSIDFMYFPTPLRAGATANFYANNVAFRREVFDQYRYQELDGVYRAHCQVMGMRLQAAGIAIHYAVDAHTEHRLPDTRRELLKLRWMRGEDSVSLTPYLVRAHLPAHLQWLGNSGPIGPWCVMAMRLGYSLRAVNRQDLPPLRGLRRLGAVAMTVGLSSIDTLGAVVRGCMTVVRRPADRGLEALSYHRH
jgi:hypothetical protein